MPEIGWAGLGVVPEVSSDFGRKLGRDIDPSLSRVARDSGKRFGGLLGKAALATSAGLLGAGFAAFQFGKDALGEAREAQEVGKTSAAILKATGHAANLSRKEYDKLTASLMRKTAIDDEQIATGGNLLLTFKNVKREGKGLNDIFGRALSNALDLSAAGFGSIESASVMLGKALNDPVKGVTALGRAGVTFSDDQKAAIKAMVASNDLLGAQKIILREVESQVGGTAEKQKTSAKELEVAWGNVKEEIGFGMIPVAEDLADVLLDKGVPAARDFSDWLTDKGVPAAKDFAEEVKPLAKELLPAAADALGTMKDAGEKLLPIVKDVVGAFNDMPDWAKKGAVLGALGLGVGAKLKGKGGKGGSLFGSASGGSITDPAYVWVVNGDLGGSGKGGKGGKGILGGTSLLKAGVAITLAEAINEAASLAGDQVKSKTFDVNLANSSPVNAIKALWNRDADQFIASDIIKRIFTGPDKAADELTHGTLKAGKALEALGLRADKLMRKDDRRDLSKIMQGKPVEGSGDPLDISSTWDKIPDKKLKLLMDPKTEQTRKGVRELLDNVDGLTRQDLKVIFNVLGLKKAKDDAATLLQYAHELTGMNFAGSIPKGFQGPFKSPNLPSSSNPKQVGPGLTVENVTVNTHDPRRFVSDMQQVQRRKAIGGY